MEEINFGFRSGKDSMEKRGYLEEMFIHREGERKRNNLGGQHVVTRGGEGGREGRLWKGG